MPWNKVRFSVMKFLLPLKIYTKNVHIPYILERYRWIFLKLCQIIALILGLIPMIFPTLANFSNPNYLCQLAALWMIINFPLSSEVSSSAMADPGIQSLASCSGGGVFYNPHAQGSGSARAFWAFTSRVDTADKYVSRLSDNWTMEVEGLIGICNRLQVK